MGKIEQLQGRDLQTVKLIAQIGRKAPKGQTRFRLERVKLSGKRTLRWNTLENAARAATDGANLFCLVSSSTADQLNGRISQV